MRLPTATSGNMSRVSEGKKQQQTFLFFCCFVFGDLEEGQLYEEHNSPIY